MIDVPIVTWPNHPRRFEYLRENVDRLVRWLTADEGVRFLIASESERDPRHEWCGEQMERLAADHGIAVHYRPDPAGLGENMNHALSLCESDLTLLIQDDHWLLEPLDLTNGAQFMRDNPGVDLLRYSWPGEDRVDLIPQPDGWARFGLDKWPYGDDPCLRRGNFAEKFSPYLEAVPHGVSEGDMLRRLRQANAHIRAADRIYFGHAGGVPAAIRDSRPGHERLRDVG